MDRQPHDYGAPMTYGQQPQTTNMQQQYSFHPQHQQFPPSVLSAPFMPPHPSLQQFPYPRPMYPHLPPPHLHQHGPPPSFPPHMPSPFHGQYDSPPPPTPPPSDPELHKRIEKLIEYAIKNGPEFEVVVREREQDNPAYSFLFGGEGHNYYRYKLFIATRPHVGPYNPSFQSSMPIMHPPNAPMGSAHLQQPPFPYYEQQHLNHSQSLVGHSRPEFDQTFRPFNGLSRPLSSDLKRELDGVLNVLTGTKESIKSAKTWFMQRLPFLPELAEALRDRVFSLDDYERQLHIVYLANDILFESLQRRTNPREVDNEALAFKPVLGSMLARVYHNPQNKEENQPRLEKILQFWASKDVYDQDTIFQLENEMLSGMTLPPNPAAPGTHEKQVPLIPSLPLQQFHPSPIPPTVGLSSSIPQLPLLQSPPPPKATEKLPSYPLFPPGLIPGMVRKMQIGSGVPYSPMSPLDIPTVIPPSNISPTEILERVSKFYREIGEVNPSAGPTKGSGSDDDYEYQGDLPVRKGGACIPPPPSLNLDSDGSVGEKLGSSSSGRLGLGATADPNEVSQYDDVYSSYRKNRSTNYHTVMSARATTR